MKLRIKIICGYATIIAITGLGTTTGFLIGNHYQKQALHNREIASRERKFINQLQIAILYNRPAKQLGPYLNQPEEFNDASQNFQNRLINIKKLLNTHNNSSVNLVLPELQSLLYEYEIKVDSFYKKVVETTSKIQPLTSSSSTKESIESRELIVALARGKEFIEFVEFPDKLAKYAQMAQSREEEAEVNLARAEKLRTQIIVASLLLSIPIATLLGLYISREITQPLSAVTQIAQRVSMESNFNLQAPVTTKDEVGILATTFNQMVSQIHSYTQELNQTLIKLQQTQGQIVQTEKMAALGQIVAGVAHEINNPVSFVYTNLIHLEQNTQELLNLVQLYQQEYPHPTSTIEAEIEAIDLDFLTSDIPQMLTSMNVGSKRIYKIVESLRNFAHLDEAGLKSVDIHQGIDNTILLLRKRLEDKPNYQKIVVIKNYNQLPLVECFPSQLNQVFFNVLSNAIDALDEHNRHRQVENIEQNPSMIEIVTKNIDSHWVAIEITDNGLGIPSEIHSKIFDPFFTTKPVGKGTGLGLSISHQIIVEKHHGMIMFDSVPGEGTTLTIKLPVKSS